MIATFASIIVVANILQRTGFLGASVNTEHYHDLGKLMFGFIVFWAYIGFSQYMLQWYANIAETIPWWSRRGVSTATYDENTYGAVGQYGTFSLILLFGHFVIPFIFLLSRHIKRNRDLLLLGAVWMLVMCWIDLYWLIMPELNNGVFYFGLPEVLCAVGLIGVFVAIVTGMLAKAPLRPIKDPRLPESLAFHNI